MHRLVLALGLFLAAVATGPAGAQTISKAELAAFADNAYFFDGSESHWDQILGRITKQTSDPAAAVSRFARQVSLPEDKARTYVRLIVDVDQWEHSCSYERDPAKCGKSALYILGAALDAAVAEPTGGLLIVIGKGVSNDKQATARFMRLAVGHTQAGKILSAVYGYNEDPVVGIPAIALRLDGIDVSQFAHARVSRTPVQISLHLATLEAALAAPPKPGEPADLRPALAQKLLMLKLQLGLVEEAIRNFEALPPALRDQLPAREPSCNKDDSCPQEDYAYQLVDELTAAYRVARGAVPPGLFSMHGSGAMPLAKLEGFPPRGGSQDTRAALAEALTPTIDNAALFERLAIPPKRARDPAPAPRIERQSWLQAMIDAGPAARKLVSGRARVGGYPEIATSIDEMNRNFFESDYDKSDASALGILDILPWEVRWRQSYWITRLALQQAAASAGDLFINLSTLAATPLPSPPWIEKKLPAGVVAWRPDESGQEPSRPRLLSNLPVPEWAVLRYGAEGGEQQIIFGSSDYDMAGEIPAFGFWFQRTLGGKWQKPLYLGLQQHFPYVVAPTSRLPLLNGDMLQIEVRAEEIDTRTITFPPVGLGFKRRVGGIYIEMSLTRLAADADDDGLTDIEERRLRLDPANRDHDGDGMPDGWDPLPLTAIDRDPPRWRQALAYTILEKLRGHDQGAIVAPPSVANPGDPLGALVTARKDTQLDTIILGADPQLFSGLTLSYRLMVYPPPALAALSRGGAPSYPARVTEVFSSLDRHTHYVSWTASWTGGSFIVRCDENFSCKTEVLSEWIT